MCEMSHNHHDREPKGFGFLVDIDTDDDVRRQQPTLFRRAMNSWMIVLVLLTLTAIKSADPGFELRSRGTRRIRNLDDRAFADKSFTAAIQSSDVECHRIRGWPHDGVPRPPHDRPDG
jgi:hypothetical protein